MSYILDALKKSDQERQQGAGPSLQTIHRPHGNSGERGWLYVLLVMVVLLLLALAGLFAWFVFDKGSNDIEQAETITPLTKVGVSGTAPKQSAPIEKKSAQAASASALSETEQAGVPANTSATSTSRVVVPFSQLPLAARNAIPAMTFSFHVYSDNPDRRTIIINGRRVKQGAVIDNQLTLDEITPNGVIFSWQDYQFSIPVVEAW